MPTKLTADARVLWILHGGPDASPTLAILAAGLGTDQAGTPLADLVDVAMQLQEGFDPHQVAALKAGWRIQPDTINYTNTPGELSIMHSNPALNDSCYEPSAEGWKLCCEENDIEVVPTEIQEHLIVSEWLADELAKHGELITSAPGAHYWSRSSAAAAVPAWHDPAMLKVAAEHQPAVEESFEP